MFRWYQTYQAKGPQGLQPKPTLGRPPRLSLSQKRKLVKVLLKGPLVAGYRTDLRTLQRVAEVTERHFGVAYHPSHVWKLLVSLGWSCGETGAPGAAKKRTADCPLEALPLARHKKTEKLGAHLVFLDESGFLLIPNVTRT